MKATDFTLATATGAPFPLAQFEDHPILIVNTASKCGFTPQYPGLQSLYTEYSARGLTLLAIPSNDFGAQEPGTDGDIAAFCTARSVTFPIAAKAHVKGPQAIPLYRWLAAQAGFLGRPRWNFYKYLIGRDGQLVQWFSSRTTPENPRLRATIERNL